MIFVGCVTIGACGSQNSTIDEGSSGGTSGSVPSGELGGRRPGTTSGEASDAPLCATGEAAAARMPVYVDIILDGSRSMDGHGDVSAGCDNAYTHTSGTCFLLNGREPDPLAPGRTVKICHDGSSAAECPTWQGLTGKKWIAIRAALLAFYDAARSKADKRLGLGMYLFGSEVVKAPTQWDVKPAFVDDAQLQLLRTRVLPNVFPTGSGTPLRASIEEQAKLLQSFTPASPLETNGKRVLVVITDGAATDGKEAAVSAASRLLGATPSITTFVIGVGEPTAADVSVYDATFLSRLASAGGAAPAGCNADWDGQSPTGTPCHFQITPGQKSAAQLQTELTAAMDAISGTVQSCELTVNKTSPIDPAKVNVVLVDGAGKESQVTKDAANGWRYDNEVDPKQVILNGTACAALKADATAKVTLVIGCPTGTTVR
jgi:hypothetical protein